MSSTIASTVSAVTTTVTASVTSTPKAVCYNRWFHPQSCVWNKIEMGFTFAALGCLALSGILYLIVGCAECFGSGKKDKKKGGMERGGQNEEDLETSKLEMDEDRLRPSSGFDTPRNSNVSQQTLVPPVRPSADYSNPFDDPSPYNERTSSYNPATVSTSSSSYSPAYPTPSFPGANVRPTPPQWSEEPEDVTEQQYLIPRPMQAAAKPGFRESY
ncbi:hypothetical protein BC629DRAFT_1589298 [Irpex lacteus]|nr:hypothetical protein BC629DRAFT_1589298 [Irpex lacteus]